MPEQQELNLETIPLEELRALAEKESPEPEPEPEPAPAPAPEPPPADIEVPEEDSEPEQYVVKSEIDLGDGSGVQVFTGIGATEVEALRDQNHKLVEAQRHATKKIHDLNSKVKTEDARTEQQKADDEYVIAQRLQKEPSRAIRDVVKEVIAEREAETARALEAQRVFVDTHPDYVADPDNGRRITAEVQRLGFNEFTETSLEKAYQSLKASGLLKLKVEEAGGTTEEETVEPERIVPTRVESTQPRSPKRASTVSTRGSSPAVVKSTLTEDELYALPMDKLKELANRQLASE